MNISLIGIFLGLVLLMVFAYRGCSTIWVAPARGAFVALLSGLSMSVWRGNAVRAESAFSDFFL